MSLKDVYTDTIQSIATICSNITSSLEEYNASEISMETEEDLAELTENEIYYKLLQAVNNKLENLQ